MNSLKPVSLFLFLLSLVSAVNMVFASDPDILSDFVAPTNTSVDGKFFNYTGMRGVLAKFPQNFTLKKATMNEFPALNGQSVSYAVLQYPAGSLNPPHAHPRAAELLFLVYGSLDVGFVDTKNVLYTQKLQVGDMFIFPKGLVHYQSNPTKEPAVAISSFGSANAGTVSVQQELMMEFLPKHSRPMFIPFKRSSPALASPEPSLDSSKKACTFVFQAINNYSLGSESRLMFVRTSKS